MREDERCVVDRRVVTPSCERRKAHEAPAQNLARERIQLRPSIRCTPSPWKALSPVMSRRLLQRAVIGAEVRSHRSRWCASWRRHVARGSNRWETPHCFRVIRRCPPAALFSSTTARAPEDALAPLGWLPAAACACAGPARSSARLLARRRSSSAHGPRARCGSLGGESGLLLCAAASVSSAAGGYAG
jgi:hypothetical protein